ncbi:hypothetical protein DFH27DRAFT_597891 [Peziza echinospora]|nr:hypothetical protein DFH27DRAFT_597891 [Peziza echinospora]
MRARGPLAPQSGRLCVRASPHAASGQPLSAGALASLAHARRGCPVAASGTSSTPSRRSSLVRGGPCRLVALASRAAAAAAGMGQRTLGRSRACCPGRLAGIAGVGLGPHGGTDLCWDARLWPSAQQDIVSAAIASVWPTVLPSLLWCLDPTLESCSPWCPGPSLIAARGCSGLESVPKGHVERRAVKSAWFCSLGGLEMDSFWQLFVYFLFPTSPRNPPHPQTLLLLLPLTPIPSTPGTQASPPPPRLHTTNPSPPPVPPPSARADWLAAEWEGGQLSHPAVFRYKQTEFGREEPRTVRTRTRPRTRACGEAVDEQTRGQGERT